MSDKPESAAAPETPSGAPAPATNESATPGSNEAAEPAASPDGSTPAELGAEPQKPDAPDPAKLTKWSQKLTRREDRLRTQQAEFDAKQRSLNDQLELAKAFESKKLKPVIDAYAKRHGLTFSQAYDALTHEAVNPDQPTVDEVVDRRIEERETARQQAQQQAQQQAIQSQVSNYVKKADPYVKQAMAKHEFLADLVPDVVSKVAIGTVVDHWMKTGQELSLDQVLSDMNTIEQKRIEKHVNRLRPGDPQVQANSERENGAGQSAKHESRKRPSPQTLNNSHAAQSASTTEDEEDLSDKALTAKAVKQLRGIPGWH